MNIFQRTLALLAKIPSFFGLGRNDSIDSPPFTKTPSFFGAIFTRIPSFFGLWPNGALPFIASPWLLAITDVLLFIFYFPLIPVMIWHSFGASSSPKLNISNWRNVAALLWQVLLVIYAFVVIAFVRYVSYFGYRVLLPPQGTAAVVVGTFIVAIAWHLATRPLKYKSRGGEEFAHESWLFINGIGSGKTWREQNCEALATMFGRKIMGINNRTFGFILDIFECIIQRCFGYTTEDARQLYYSVQSELRKDDIHRVVLIAHSQGAIIASLVVDRLLASESTTDLKKLELYTFGSAANHMHGAGDLSCIEHFVNRWDYIAQTSILSYQPVKLTGSNRYDGKMYIDNDELGHSLSTHYLPSMFAEGGAGAGSFMAKYLGGKEPNVEAEVGKRAQRWLHHIPTLNSMSDGDEEKVSLDRRHREEAASRSQK